MSVKYHHMIGFRAHFQQFFPTSRIILLRKKIRGIQQEEGESFPTYYECFKSLVASCPQHQMKEELLLQYFYEGLLPLERQILNASMGGALVDKTPMAAKILIANQVLNAQQYEGVGQRGPPRQQVHEMAEGMKIQGPMVCGVCSIQGHASEKCPQLIENGGWESANAIGFQSQNQPRNDPYSNSNTYNPGWRDHPNFKWREPQQSQPQGGFRQQPPGFYTKPYAPPQVQPQSAPNASATNQAMHNTNIWVDQLEKKIRQIAEFVGQFRDQGKLPSSTIANPKGGFETAKAITLRSGKEVGAGPTPSKSGHKEDENFNLRRRNQANPRQRWKHLCRKCPWPLNLQICPIRNEEEEKDVLETFRKVHVNIPLLDAIKQIPKYAKCLKKLCTTKKRVREKEVVHVSKNVSVMLQRKLPQKCKDPGASINVMPYSIYASMNLGALKHDGVDHLIFPADFYILEMDELDHAPSLPILLGRPFMKTAQTKIDVAKDSSLHKQRLITQREGLHSLHLKSMDLDGRIGFSKFPKLRTSKSPHQGEIGEEK
ncbi:unnamed protein product [Malus baccata var. baccata]